MAKAKCPNNNRRPESKAVQEAIVVYKATGDIEPLKAALSPRMRAFCEEYVVDYKGNNAIIRAGYSQNQPEVAAHTMMKNEGIRVYIDHLTRSKEAKAVAVNPDYILAQLTALMHKEGIRDSDKIRTIELMMKHFGMLTDKVEQKTTIDIQEKQRVEEEASSVTNALKTLRDRRLKESEDKPVTIL